MKNTIKSNFAKPLLPLVISFGVYLVFSFVYEPSSLQEAYQGYLTNEQKLIENIVFFAISLASAYIIQFILLIPIVGVLRKKELLNIKVLIFTGFLISLLFTLIVQILLTPDVYPYYWINWFVYFSVYFIINLLSGFKKIDIVTG